MRWTYAIILCIFLWSTSCKTSFYLTEVSASSLKLVSTFHTVDSSIAVLISPYQVGLENKMNEIVGKTSHELTKQKPESTLGNLLADATLEVSKIHFANKPDLAIINYGGIRVSNLAKGEISLGQIYELMPFDNQIVLLEINGATLQEVFGLMAAKGGWPISGASYTISKGKAKNIMVNNAPIKHDYIYSIVLSDYLANGGDNLEMLKNIPQQNKNILLRDVFIHFFKTKLKNKEVIRSKLDNRIVYE